MAKTPSPTTNRPSITAAKPPDIVEQLSAVPSGDGRAAFLAEVAVLTAMDDVCFAEVVLSDRTPLVVRVSGRTCPDATEAL